VILLLPGSNTYRLRGAIIPMGHQPGQSATNAGRTFPPEILTTTEVAALIGDGADRDPQPGAAVAAVPGRGCQ
jgi:hypothetical protein